MLCEAVRVKVRLCKGVVRVKRGAGNWRGGWVDFGMTGQNQEFRGIS